MKYIISILLMFFCESTLAIDMTVQYKNPEDALEHYISALRKGSLKGIEQILIPIEGRKFQFYLPGPISIHHVELAKRTEYTEKMVLLYKAIPKPKKGDIQLDVKQYMGKVHDVFMYTYIFRKIENGWFILSSTAWDQP